MNHQTRIAVASSLVALVAGAGTLLASATLTSQTGTPDDISVRLAPTTRAEASSTFAGIDIQFGPATQPGLSCVEIKGLDASAPAEPSGVCQETANVKNNGLLVETRQADGTYAVYGVGPTGTTRVLHDGAPVSAASNGLYFVRGIAAEATGRVTFETPKGRTSLEYGPMPPLPAP